MVLLHLVEHRSGRGHRLLQDQAPLMVLKNKSNRKCKLTYHLHHKHFTVCNIVVVWTSQGPLPRWVPGPTTRWAPGTTRLALHGT
jgi:hypothetical protein